MSMRRVTVSYHLTISPHSDEYQVIGYVGSAWELPTNVKVATVAEKTLEQCAKTLLSKLQERQEYLSRMGHLFDDLPAEERERWIRFGIDMNTSHQNTLEVLRRVADANPLSSWSRDFYRALDTEPYWVTFEPEAAREINWMAVFRGFLLALIPTILILLSFHAAGIL